MCIAGNSGCGKSYVGKALRKGGMGRIRPTEILVIDDGVASIPLLGIFRRRVKFRTEEKDFLRPFEPYFRGKKLIVFLDCQPAKRVDECDILIEVSCPEDLRRQRLRQRNADADKRVSDTAGYLLVKPSARSEFELANDGKGFSLRSREATHCSTQ
jgi:broad-specificity NMP kinase